MLCLSAKFQVCCFINSKFLPIFKKGFNAPGQYFRKPRYTCKIFLMLHISIKFRVYTFQSSSYILEKQFLGPHQARSKFWKAPGHVPMFLKPYLPAKFHVSRLPHSKFLAFFRRNSFQGPIRLRSKFWKIPR